jgi:hypothetical protein
MRSRVLRSERLTSVESAFDSLTLLIPLVSACLSKNSDRFSSRESWSKTDLAFGGMMIWWWLTGVDGDDALKLEEMLFVRTYLRAG